MIMIIPVVMLAIGVVISHHFDRKNYITSSEIGYVISIVGLLAIVVAGLIAIVVNFNANGTMARYKQKYESITYQIENSVGQKEVYEEVQEWNECIAEGKAMQDDYWFGVFYPDIYDEFELIEVENVENKK